LTSLVDFRATNHCCIDHAIINSGVSKASNVINPRAHNPAKVPPFGPVMFGWAAVHVQSEIVTRQLWMIAQIDLSSQEEGNRASNPCTGKVSFKKRKPWFRRFGISGNWVVLECPCCYLCLFGCLETRSVG